MATDKTEPRIGLIVSVAVASVFGLLGFRLVLQSYFSAEMMDEAESKVLAQPPTQLRHQRESEQQRLENGPVPIHQAMEVIMHGGRPAVIEPRPSVDYAPMNGWTQRPQRFVPPPTTIQPGPTLAPGAALMQGGASGAAPGTGVVAAPATSPEQAQSAQGIAVPVPSPTAPHPPASPPPPAAGVNPEPQDTAHGGAAH